MGKKGKKKKRKSDVWYEIIGEVIIEIIFFIPRMIGWIIKGFLS